MRKCKILHINDGSAKVITNGDRHFVEEHPWAEDLIEGYLNQGYEVKQMIPNIPLTYKRMASIHSL